MALLLEKFVRQNAARVPQEMRKSLVEIAKADNVERAEDGFDVFLSHSSSEPEEILLGIIVLLSEVGLSVYVDRYYDPQLSLDGVTKKTAELLRVRMQQSRSLLYVYSQYSKKSRWMPWELGYFDGHNGNVGMIPVTMNGEDTFKGEEYLSLYPYVDRAKISNSDTEVFWINESKSRYARLTKWIDGSEMIGPHG